MWNVSIHWTSMIHSLNYGNINDNTAQTQHQHQVWFEHKTYKYMQILNKKKCIVLL